MPHFYKGYDSHLDLTEDEWLEQQLYNSMGEYEDEPRLDKWDAEFEGVPGIDPAIEPEPFEDTYLPGIPDYDIFNRPSWEVED